MEAQLQQQRQREAQRQAQEEARQKNSGLKWAARAQVPTPQQPVKSLLEIQAEEEKELKKVQSIKYSVSTNSHVMKSGDSKRFWYNLLCLM